MSTLAADSIIFAINAAVRLGDNIRKAYVHSIRAKALVLPLPDFDPDIKLLPIIGFFNKHPEFVAQSGRLKELHHKITVELDLPAGEAEEYRQFFYAFETAESENGAKLELSAMEVLALTRIRQWEKGKAPASVLQLVAGTIVEIGIDYFAQAPGALNPESVHGRLMQRFLGAFDGISLADNPQIKQDLSRRLVPRLFSAAAESLADLSTNIAADEKVQTFIQATAKGIADDIYRRAETLGAEGREEAVQWGQLVLRSMIRNAGHYALSAPQSFFGTNQPVSRIIESSGLVLLDAILGDETEKVAFKNALSPETLDRLAQATLSVIAEHPNVISGERGIKEILSAVATVAKDRKISEGGYLPELARIVLEQSAGRLELFWRDTPQGAEHLLVTAVGQVLSAISEQKDGDTWKPALSKTQVLNIVEELVDDVVQNPAWILDEVHDRSALSEVLDSVFGAMHKLPKGERLSADALRTVLRAGMQTALVNRRVLDKVRWGSDEEESTILSKALDLAFAGAFPPNSKADLGRLQLLSDLLDYVSTVLLRRHPDEKGLVLLDLILFRSGIDYSRGFDPQLADQLTDAALHAMATQPELAAKPEALRNILAGVASALHGAGLKQPNLLPTLVQLLLRHTGLNAHLLIDADPQHPRHLILTAMQQILATLSASDGSGKWNPGITGPQAVGIIEHLLDEIVRHPFWLSEKVEQDSLLAEVLDIVFKTLEMAPAGTRLQPEHLQNLLQQSLRAVAASPRVLEKVRFAGDEQEKEVLQRALELVFAYTFTPGKETTSRALLLPDLIQYVLDVLLSRYPDKRSLILIDLILFEYNGIDYSQGFRPELVEQLADAALAVLAQHPELVTNDQVLHHVVANIAGAFHASGLNQPDLLPELIRLTLQSTAEHIDLLLDTGRDNTRHLFILAAWQVLSALAQPSETDEWKPRLSNAQVLEIIDLVYDTILQNPQWVLQDAYVLKLLEAVFLALRDMPAGFTVPYALIRDLVHKAIGAAGQQRELLATFQTAEGVEKLRLQSALEGFVDVLYRENEKEDAAWYLSQGHIIRMLADYYLSLVTNTRVRPEDIEAAKAQIRKVMAAWKADLSQSLASILDQLIQQP